MAITSQITVVKKNNQDTFPLLRVLNRPDDDDPLVVLFTSEDHGVPLSGVHPSRMGKAEQWIPCSESVWIPVSITLTDNG